jgi:hypothetical protein
MILLFVCVIGSNDTGIIGFGFIVFRRIHDQLCRARERIASKRIDENDECDGM